MMDNNYLCTNIPSMVTKPKVWNAGAFYLQLRGVSVITVQAPTELKSHYICELFASDDLPLHLIPLAVNHRIK